jgi:hypothetical protein
MRSSTIIDDVKSDCLMTKWLIFEWIFFRDSSILSYEFIYFHVLIFKVKFFSFSIHKWKVFEMKINIMLLKKILSSFIVKKKNSRFKNNVDIFRTSNAFRSQNKKTSTFKHYFWYLNKIIKIKFELRMLLHLCLKKKYDLEIIETLLYFWKKTKSRNLSRCYCIF